MHKLVCYALAEILAPASYGRKRTDIFWREGSEKPMVRKEVINISGPWDVDILMLWSKINKMMI